MLSSPQTISETRDRYACVAIDGDLTSMRGAALIAPEATMSLTRSLGEVNRATLEWYVRFGVAWAWLPVLVLGGTALYSPLQDAPVVVKVARALVFVGLAAVLLFAAFAWRPTERIVQRRSIVTVSAVVAALGATVVGLCGTGVLPLPWILAGSFIEGAAGGMLMMCWLQRFRRMYRRSAGVLFAGSVALVGATSLALLLCSRVSPAITTVILALLPLTALVLPTTGMSTRPPHPAEEKTRYRTPTPLLGVSTLYGAAFGVVFSVSIAPPADSASLWFGVVASALGLALFLMLGLLAGTTRPDHDYRPLLLLIPIGLLLLPLLKVGQFYTVNAMIVCGWSGAIIVMMVICAGLAARFHAPVLAFGGQMAFASTVATALMTLVLPFVEPQMSLSALWIAVIAFVTGSALLTASAFLPDEHGKIRLWGCTSLLTAETPASDLEARCAEIAKDYGLTRREQEILVPLAKGRNAEYIRETFVLSQFTVKTHMRRIYAKLGVHTHQALMDIVDGRTPTASRDECPGSAGSGSRRV